MSPKGAGRPRQKVRSSVVFLREVPNDSPVHRLWAGTKLTAIAALSLTVSFTPSWTSIGLIFAFVVGVGLIARIPLGALPRFPWVFWAFVVFGALLTLLSGGSPYIKVGGTTLGLGGVDLYLRFSSLGVLLIGTSMMVGWTTPLGEVAPALARLGSPLRRLRLPVDEWAMAVSLCIRCLPLLIDELRTLVAARRLRPRPQIDDGGTGWAPVDDLVDLVTAGLAVAVRRAGELAEAITARGGLSLVPSRNRRPGTADIVALLATGAVCVAASAIYAT